MQKLRSRLPKLFAELGGRPGGGRRSEVGEGGGSGVCCCFMFIGQSVQLSPFENWTCFSCTYLFIFFDPVMKTNPCF